jgi:hypothetical protein
LRIEDARRLDAAGYMVIIERDRRLLSCADRPQLRFDQVRPMPASMP